MNRGLLLACTLLMVLAGCAEQKAFHAGDKYYQQGAYDQAMEEYAAAIAENPARSEYRMKWLDSRHRAALSHFDRGKELEGEGDLLQAADEYRRASLLDGTLAAAVQKLKAIQDRLQADELIAAAQKSFQAGRYPQARAELGKVMHLDPDNPAAADLLHKIDLAGQTIMDGYELELASREPLSLQFANMDLHQAFAVVGQLSGIHFILDDEVSARPVSLLLKKASFAQVLDLMLKLNGLGKRVLNSRTILVYPKTPEKEKQYEDRIIQVFYLSNIEAKNAVNMLRTMLQARKIYVHEELNAIVMRDKPEVVELARQILEAADRNDSEVVFDLELVEVSHRDVLELGPKLSSYSVSAGFGRTILDSEGASVTNLISDTLTAGGSTDTLVKSFSSLEAFYTLPTATFDFAKTLIDTEILASPKIRVKNREKAKVHIGTREPIVTTNISTTTGDVTSTNVQYIDVGVKLDIEPTIQLDGTVVTNLTLEVSSILEKEEIAGGGFALRISTTNAGSSLILEDGERTIIGGLIRDDLSNTRDTLPFLGRIPILGHLFTGRSDEKSKGEILLSITPHIVRNVDMPRPDVATIWSGSEDDLAPGARFASFTGNTGPTPEVDDETGRVRSASGETENGGVAALNYRLQGPEAVEPGQTVVVKVFASDVRNLLHTRVALRYPADLVEFVDVKPGALMGDGADSQALVLPGAALGRIAANIGRTAGKPGVSGSGPVAEFAFKVTGNAALTFSLDECSLNEGQGLSRACVAEPLTLEMN